MKLNKLNIKSNPNTEIFANEHGNGGASHEYSVAAIESAAEFAFVRFQNGPINEVGVNGCQNEDLLAIVLDRLEAFQAGEFRCRENALAITKIEEALHWLNHRTADRESRGVEGLNVK